MHHVASLIRQLKWKKKGVEFSLLPLISDIKKAFFDTFQN
jgi:nitric oxide synthase oxygenase domain/subunit